MKQVAFRVINSSLVYDRKKIEDLDEKRIVPKMMIRRRLTRNAKVLLYLADKCDFRDGKVVYGSCFSELEENAKIAKAVANDESISAISFQNSVYNTAPSYLSLIYKNTDEIITISSGMKTSLDALKSAVLQSLVSKQRVLCVCVECIDIENIEEVNNCTAYLEAGVAVVIEASEDLESAVKIEDKSIRGMIGSLNDLMSVANMHKSGIEKMVVEL